MTISYNPYELDQNIINYLVLLCTKYIKKKELETNKSDIYEELYSQLYREYIYNILNKYKENVLDNAFNTKLEEALQHCNFSTKHINIIKKILKIQNVKNLLDMSVKKGWYCKIVKLNELLFVDYSIKYLDIILKFLDKNYGISTSGKNVYLYNKFISKAHDFSFLNEKSKMNLDLDTNRYLDKIVSIYNTYDIGFCTENYFREIDENFSSKISKCIPQMDKYCHNNDDIDLFYFNLKKYKETRERFYQKNPISYFQNFITFFKDCMYFSNLHNISNLLDKLNKRSKYMKCKNLYDKRTKYCNAIQCIRKYSENEDLNLHNNIDKILESNINSILSQINNNLIKFLENYNKTKYKCLIDNNKICYESKKKVYDLYDNLYMYIDNGCADCRGYFKDAEPTTTTRSPASGTGSPDENQSVSCHSDEKESVSS